MSMLLELLGKGLEQNLMALVLPETKPLGQTVLKFLSHELGDDPVGTSNKLRLAIHYSQSGNAEQAEHLFEEIVQSHPKHIEARLAWAAVNCSSGAMNKAIELLTESLQIAKSDLRVLFALGYCYERSGDMEQAQRFYEKGCQGRGYFRQIHERLAAISLFNLDYTSAIYHCKTLQKYQPEETWIYLALGQLYMETQQEDLACETFERALTIDPDNFDLHNDDVEKLIEQGMLADAITHLHKQLEQQGDFPDTFVRLGDLYYQVGNDDAAVSHYRKALALHPGYLEAAVKLGTQHLRQKRYFEAAGSFNRAVEINDQLIAAYVGLAAAQEAGGKSEQAADTLDLAAALEPNTNLLFAEVARLQLKISQEAQQSDEMQFASEPEKMNADDLLETQMQRHQHALEQNPHRADLHYRYGLMLRGGGHLDEAIHHFRQALEINGSYLKAQIKLGLALREKGQDADAMHQLAQALTLRSEYIELHYRLGVLHCDPIEFALAVEHFGTLFGNMKEDDVEANMHLAIQNMGLVDRATATWRAVCELDPDRQMAFQAQRNGISLKTVR